MKKLFALLLLLGAIAFAARNSVLYSVWQLKTGLEAGNVAQVERFADLKALSTVPVDAAVVAAEGAAQEAGGALGAIVGAIGSLVGGAVKGAAGGIALEELKSRIEKRDLLALLGGFAPNAQPFWFGGTQDVADGAVVTVKGTCNARESKGARVEAQVGLRLVRVPGPLLGYPAEYKVVAVEAESLRALVKNCAF